MKLRFTTFVQSPDIVFSTFKCIHCKLLRERKIIRNRETKIKTRYSCLARNTSISLRGELFDIKQFCSDYLRKPGVLKKL